MNYLIFFIVFFSNMIVYFAISNSLKSCLSYKNGMILGMHIDESCLEDEDLKELIKKYKKIFKYLKYICLVGGLATAFFIFFSMVGFIWLLMAWVFVVAVYSQVFTMFMMRSMYRLKEDKGWINDKSKTTLRVDTRVSASNKKLNINIFYHLPILIILIYTILDLYFRGPVFNKVFAGVILTSNANVVDELRMTMVYILCLGVFMSVVYMLVHYWYANKQNKVYCDDTDVNYKVNRVDKWYWSLAMLVGSFGCLLANTYLLFDLMIHDWVYYVAIFIYIFILLVSNMASMYLLFMIGGKREDLLRGAKNIEYIDDDYYWRKGYYFNPDSKKLMVQNRISSTNLSFNMAKTSAKLINFFTAILVVGVAIILLYVTVGGEDIDVVMNKDSIKISSNIYHIDINKKDIREIGLVEDTVDKSFIKNNGMSIDEIDIGYYTGKKEGRVLLFINSEKRPLLRIKTKDKLVYISGDDNFEVENLYKFLIER